MVNPHDITSNESFVKLWYHEMMREFNDRFNSDSDRSWFQKTMNETIAKNFNMNINQKEIMLSLFSDNSLNYKECNLEMD